MAEFKLSFTAQEIDEKLGKISTLAEKSEIPSKLSELVDDKGFATEEYVDSAVERVSGNTGDFKGIIDVVKLPTENIREDVMYRLISAKVYFNFDTTDDFTCYCVESLPETGVPATDVTQTEGNVYYNLSDGNAYGYVDEMLSAGMSVPVGWYDGAILLGAMGYAYNGVVTDISDLKDDDSFRLLLNYDYYVYKNEWTKLVFAYEKPPKFDVTWDGDMTDRTVIDMSLLGYDAGTYFVKVSDKVLSVEDVIGGLYTYYYAPDDSHSDCDVEEYQINTDTYPGAFTIDNFIVIVHSEEELCTALGIPVGYITNGVYYLKDNNWQVERLCTPKRVTKIDGKYLDLSDVSLDDVYSKYEVDSKIANAIGSAIVRGY